MSMQDLFENAVEQIGGLKERLDEAEKLLRQQLFVAQAASEALHALCDKCNEKDLRIAQLDAENERMVALLKKENKA